jgi:hypothetical protein
MSFTSVILNFHVFNFINLVKLLLFYFKFEKIKLVQIFASTLDYIICL